MVLQSPDSGKGYDFISISGSSHVTDKPVTATIHIEIAPELCIAGWKSLKSCDILLRMTRVFRQCWFTFFLAITLAITSFQFASHSVRAEVVNPQLVVYLASGGALEDICQTGDADHTHAECPFCRETGHLVLPDHIGALRPCTPATSQHFANISPLCLTADASLRPPARAPPRA